MPTLNKLLEAKKLRPYIFEPNKYIGRVGYATNEIYKHKINGFVFNRNVLAVGYCKASMLTTLQREDYMAILFYHKMDNVYFWTHFKEYDFININVYNLAFIAN